MNQDFTFSIIKPNAVKNKNIGPILAMINEAGFRISALKMVRMTKAQSQSFYGVHKDRPFYNDLCDFMISGPIVVLILKQENAVDEFRKLIGSTDPEKAEGGTIRKLFAASLQMNAVHGSDSQENAKIEASFFFSGFERFYT
jgi:nucleoside-diphosphate kinase